MTDDRVARLLALVSHEFRGPAVVMGGYLKLLAREAETLAERPRALAGKALGAHGALHALLEELAELVRLTSGDRALERRPVPLATLAEEVAAQASGRPGRPAVSVGTLPNIVLNVDRQAFVSALASLGWAAARPLGEEATVRLTGVLGEAAPPALRLFVFGGDLPPEGAPAPLDDTRGGMGLALPLARAIVEAHGGTVEERPATGAGPAFVVTVGT
jgi:two-component system, OmpR family, sensor kinase